MSNAAVQRLAQSITCHAFNGDFTKVAICPNTPDIIVFAKDGDQWVQEAVLKEHDQVVSSIDWAPQTNRIVSCSHDRNAYVWTLEGDKWKPVLSVLRINRAATHVKWSPQENKFAVASGSKTVAICYFEKDNNWWISKHLKKHKSTVLSVAWHPNNLLIATGGTDMKCRVYAAAIKGVDKLNKSEIFVNRPLRTFGELLWESDATAGWIHSVCWNPGGNTLAWVAHDARIAFADVTNAQVPEMLPPVQVISLPYLPLQSALFVDDSTLIAGGHDCNPVIFRWSDADGAWVDAGLLDKAQRVVEKAAGAMNKFKSLEKTGQTAQATTLHTQHQNCIFSMVPGPPGQVSTSSVDGLLVMWTLD